MTESTASPAASPASADTPSQRRATNIALWCLQVLAAAVFVFAGIPKVTADPMNVAGFTEMGLGITGMYLVGFAELTGAVALLIPRLAGLAGLAFVGLMIGAVIFTIKTAGISSMLLVPVVTLVVVAIIAWGRRQSTAELIALVRRQARR